MSKPKYQLRVNWCNASASYTYSLWASNHYDPKHSCYSCYDCWIFERRKCHNNQNKWTRVPNATGDIVWAKKIAKHHKLFLPPKEEAL